MLAIVQHGGIVLFPLADDHYAVHMQGGEAVAHGINSRAVAVFLGAPAQPAGGSQRGGLGDAYDVQCKVFLRCFSHDNILQI